jgi:hypothetical protein
MFERGCVRNWEIRPPSNSIRIDLPPVIREFGTHPAACSPALRSRGDGYRLAEVPFATPTSTFEPRPLTLHGSLDAPGAEVAPPPAAILEDDFNSGLANWTGDTAGWRLDAAGARPAGLALLQPSLEWGDYEFEFLTRIEKRAVTFVFRASNVSNYCKITIGMADSRAYELKRCVVIEGAEEQCETVELGDKPKAGSTFPVKVSARRNDFTISLDGVVVARWTDGRLPAGGIGFTAMKGDQARVYWVRLAPLTGPNLEAVPGRQPRSKK